MRYYRNKVSGEIIGVFNMRELISHSTEQSIKLGYGNYSRQTIYDMICPNILLGAGIASFSIAATYLQNNYKRISAKIALEKYPEFRQYVYEDLVEESNKSGIKKIDILTNQKF
jgi:hypothetical protein